MDLGDMMRMGRARADAKLPHRSTQKYLSLQIWATYSMLGCCFLIYETGDHSIIQVWDQQYLASEPTKSPQEANQNCIRYPNCRNWLLLTWFDLLVTDN